jgi:hypothetical protein
MNEIIDDLKNQALEWAMETLDPDQVNEYEWAVAIDKKFSELIVRECAKYLNERTLDWDADLRWIFNDGTGDMAVDVDELLNRHFGVEE